MRFRNAITALSVLAASCGAPGRTTSPDPQAAIVDYEGPDFYSALAGTQILVEPPKLSEGAWIEFERIAEESGKPSSEAALLKQEILEAAQQQATDMAARAGLRTPVPSASTANDGGALLQLKVMSLNIAEADISNDTGLMERAFEYGQRLFSTERQLEVRIDARLIVDQRQVASCTSRGTAFATVESTFSRSVSRGTDAPTLESLRSGTGASGIQDEGADPSPSGAKESSSTKGSLASFQVTKRKLLVTGGMTEATQAAVSKAVAQLLRDHHQFVKAREAHLAQQQDAGAETSD